MSPIPSLSGAPVAISFSTLNCRGLNSDLKRAYFFSLLKNCDLNFLQETYVTDDKIEYWKDLWKDKCCFSPGTNNSQGLMILYKKDLFDNDSESVFYKSERILGLKGFIEGEEFFFINVYGPNIIQQRQNFMNELYHITALCTSNNIVFGGDFNTVLDNELDIIAGSKHDPANVQNLRNWLLRKDLVDCWRELHNVEKDFTWSRNNPFCARRLDFLIMHFELLPYLKFTNHEIVAGTDHKMVKGMLNSENSKRGSSYWKFNSSLLEDEIYINEMNKHLDEFKNLHFNNAIVRFEYLKILVKDKSIQYSSFKKQAQNRRLNFLNSELQILNKKIIADKNNVNVSNRLFQVKKELEIFELEKARGARTRAKIEEIEKNEKNTAYFLGVEKSRGVNNSIRRINVNNQTVTDQSAILKELADHFENISKKI